MLTFLSPQLADLQLSNTGGEPYQHSFVTTIYQQAPHIACMHTQSYCIKISGKDPNYMH